MHTHYMIKTPSTLSAALLIKMQELHQIYLNLSVQALMNCQLLI